MTHLSIEPCSFDFFLWHWRVFWWREAGTAREEPLTIGRFSYVLDSCASFQLLLSNWVYSGLAKRNRVVSPESCGTGFPVGWFKYSGERDHWKGALCIKYKVVVLLHLLLLESPTSMLFLLFHVFPHLYMILLFELYFCRCVPKSRFRHASWPNILQF